LVAQLDHAAVMIRLEVIVGDVPTAKAEGGIPVAEAGGKADSAKTPANAARPEEIRQQMEVLIQAQLTTLDNQTAHLQLGRREPTITAVMMNQTGRTNSVTPQNVGTILSLTPRAGADGTVTMQLDVEDSRLGPADEGVAIFAPGQGETVRAPVIDTAMAQTTLQIPDGQTVVLGSMTRQSKSGKQRVILVTPHVLPIGGEAKPAK
jgi:Flp pilus assembly secretin CpaC